MLAILSTFLFSCTDETEVIDNSEIPKSELKSFFDISGVKEMYDASARDVHTPCEQCLDDCSMDIAIAQNMASEVNTISAFTNEMRNFRDEVLLQGETGIAYTNAYYELSQILLDQNLPTVSDIIEHVKIIPTVTQIEYQLINENFNGIVINNTQKKELLDFIAVYEGKINSSSLSYQDKNRYLTMVNAVKTDLENITNRTNKQISDFLMME